MIPSPRRGHDTIIEYLQESIPAMGLVSVHPAATTQNFTAQSIIDFETRYEVVNGSIVGERTAVVFRGNSCRDRRLGPQDFALRCDEDLFNSALCWPFPRICGTTDKGEPFQTDITFLSQHGDVPLL